jgi:hypothetical protein
MFDSRCSDFNLRQGKARQERERGRGRERERESEGERERERERRDEVRGQGGGERNKHLLLHNKQINELCSCGELLDIS